MHAAGIDVANVAEILLVADRAERLPDDRVGEADDRVERRAQLVAHRRQELRLGTICLLGGVLGEAERLVGGAALLLELKLLKAAIEHSIKLAGMAGFIDIVVGAVAQRLDRSLAVDMGRHDDADQIGTTDLQLGEEVDATGETEANVEERDLGVEFLQTGMCALGGGDRPERVTLRFEQIEQRIGKIRIVIDDEQPAFAASIPVGGEHPGRAGHGVLAAIAWSSCRGSNGLTRKPSAIVCNTAMSVSPSCALPVTTMVGTSFPICLRRR